MVEDTGDDAASPTKLPWLFMSSLPVAGTLHIFANASKDVDRSLKLWNEFYKGLKTLEKLICYPSRVQRFISTCLRGTAF